MRLTSNGRHYMAKSRHSVACDDCGLLVETTQHGGYAVLCPACRDARRAVRNKARYQKTAPEFDPRGTYQVVFDPDPVGGFGQGAMLADVDITCMLERGSFSLGTRIESRGQEYVILADPNRKNKVRQRKVEI